MESHILELLGSSEDSSQNKYKNNIQYNKKQYPLNKVHVKAPNHGRDVASKAERAPWIGNLESVSTLSITSLIELLFGRASAYARWYRKAGPVR